MNLTRKDFQADALRSIASSADTLSPQEFINNAARGLGIAPWRYAGECNPNASLMEWRIMAGILSRAMAPVLASFREEKATIKHEWIDAVLDAMARIERLRGARCQEIDDETGAHCVLPAGHDGAHTPALTSIDEQRPADAPRMVSAEKVREWHEQVAQMIQTADEVRDMAEQFVIARDHEGLARYVGNIASLGRAIVAEMRAAAGDSRTAPEGV